MQRAAQPSWAPIALPISPTELPDFDAVLSHLLVVAQDIESLSLVSDFFDPVPVIDERMLLSWPRLARLQLDQFRLLACPATDSEHAAAHETVNNPYFDEDIELCTSDDLFHILPLMPNLQELKIFQVPPRHSETLTPTPPVCRLRCFQYHSSNAPCDSWHFPLLSSFRRLRKLSLSFGNAPPHASVLATAEIIGPSVEVVFLQNAALHAEVAGVLLPSCTRLRALIIGYTTTKCDIARLVDMIACVPCAPLRTLYVTTAPVLTRLVGQVLEAGFPPALRQLRQLHCNPVGMRSVVARYQFIGSYKPLLLRVCARRRIQFVVKPLSLTEC